MLTKVRNGTARFENSKAFALDAQLEMIRG